MNIEIIQQDMRHSYYGGAPGVLASGLVWLIAGIVAYFVDMEASMLTYFFGGMLIHPIGLLLSKLFGRSGRHDSDNPFGKLAMESTVLIFVGLFIAYMFFQNNGHTFYEIMLLIIGARYLVFQTIYGNKIYWIIGILMIAAGVQGLLSVQAFYFWAVFGGLLEIIFSIIMIIQEKKGSVIIKEHL